MAGVTVTVVVVLTGGMVLSFLAGLFSAFTSCCLCCRVGGVEEIGAMAGASVGG